MWDVLAEDQDLVRSLAYDVVEVIAKRELVRFDSDIEDFFADPASAMKKQPPADSFLGMGGIDPTPFATLAAAAFALALPLIQAAIQEALKDEIGEAIKQALRRLFRRDKKEDDQQSVRVKQAEDGEPKVLVFNLNLPSGHQQALVVTEPIKDVLIETLVRQGFGSRRATKIAQAVIARIAANDRTT